jgi:hypothetical protein
MGMFDDVIPEKMTTNELFRELRDLTKRLERLEELKAPQPIIDFEQEKFNSVLNELMKYMSPTIIEKEMQTKWLNRKWKDDYRP